MELAFDSPRATFSTIVSSGRLVKLFALLKCFPWFQNPPRFIFFSLSPRLLSEFFGVFDSVYSHKIFFMAAPFVRGYSSTFFFLLRLSQGV